MTTHEPPEFLGKTTADLIGLARWAAECIREEKPANANLFLALAGRLEELGEQFEAAKGVERSRWESAAKVLGAKPREVR